jgi:hypothetical protein
MARAWPRVRPEVATSLHCTAARARGAALYHSSSPPSPPSSSVISARRVGVRPLVRRDAPVGKWPCAGRSVMPHRPRAQAASGKREGASCAPPQRPGRRRPRPCRPHRPHRHLCAVGAGSGWQRRGPQIGALTTVRAPPLLALLGRACSALCPGAPLAGEADSRRGDLPPAARPRLADDAGARGCRLQTRRRRRYSPTRAANAHLFLA